MPDLLEGIRVVDCTQAVQGGAVGCMLGDLGADVIKVEDITGDILRNWSRVMGVPMELAGGRNIAFEAVNRNKRSVTLNLKTEKGRQILYRLIAGADVFVTNFRPSARRRLGLDYGTLSRHNERLIYAVASAYGQKGPSADEGGYDNVAFARSGMMHCIGEEGDAPRYMTPGATDMLGGTMLALGIIGALFCRERTGRGQEVETSLLGSMTHLLTLPLNTYLLGGHLPRRPKRSELFNPLIGWYECADGEWIMFSINQPEEHWHSFCEALGLGSAVEDNPKFATTRARAANSRELVAIIDRAMLARGREEWLAECRRRGLLCAPLNRLQDIPEDVQIRENGNLVELDHPVLGKVKTVAFPVNYGQTPARVRCAAPELGQHTEEVLGELGFSWQELEELRSERVI